MEKRELIVAQASDHSKLSGGQLALLEHPWPSNDCSSLPLLTNYEVSWQESCFSTSAMECMYRQTQSYKGHREEAFPPHHIFKTKTPRASPVCSKNIPPPKSRQSTLSSVIYHNVKAKLHPSFPPPRL